MVRREVTSLSPAPACRRVASPASPQSAGWFGHSSIAVTMDIYSHLMPDMQEDAAAKVDAALVETINRSRAK